MQLQSQIQRELDTLRSLHRQQTRLLSDLGSILNNDYKTNTSKDFFAIERDITPFSFGDSIRVVSGEKMHNNSNILDSGVELSNYDHDKSITEIKETLESLQTRVHALESKQSQYKITASNAAKQTIEQMMEATEQLNTLLNASAIGNNSNIRECTQTQMGLLDILLDQLQDP